ETSQPEPSLSDAEPPLFVENTQPMNPNNLSVATPTATMSGWPVRVVSTVPGAQPPRAILGLPSGEELVVAPGSMVAEQNLVVLAVGTRTVEVAHIQADGDHANVIPMTLTAQYAP
ncbi:MAG: hypothetical protein QGG40_06360, partial [Myxococcota bacterium]|nr:hypothetical protein [Myxococcota bacterium]